MQVANHLLSMMPPTIGGATNGASADLISAFTMNAIDDAYETDQHKCGIVIDLAKCFNTIARYPILMLMKKLGMPAEYSNGLFMMLHHLSRYLEINAHIDLLVPSTTGIPEGDAFSVTLMTALTFWVYFYIEQYHDVDAIFYVDNWSFIANDVESLVAASHSMIDFVRDMKLVVSYQKSWVWATSKALRKQLRSTQFGGCTVPLQYHAKDLGCDMNYCKRRYKKTTKTRVAASIRRLGRVSTKKLPKDFRVKMAQTLGPGVSSYGAPLVLHSAQEWRKLRSSMTKSIGRFRCGSNPWLALSLVGDIRDPQLTDAIQRISFWRRFMKIFPGTPRGLLRRIGSQVTYNKAGPSFAFADSFRRMGWKCVADGVMVHTSGLQLHWVSQSMPYIKKLLTMAWSMQVSDKVQHREGFDVGCFDFHPVLRGVRKQPTGRQTMLQSLAAGKHVTHDKLCKFIADIKSEQCPLCGMPDSKMHRVFTCSETAELRSKSKALIRWLQRQPYAVWNYGAFEVNIALMLWKIENSPVLPAIQMPSETARLTVFTDGSCFFPEFHQTALAGCAAIVVDNWEYEVLFQTMMPTPDHTPFRAEVAAILLTLQKTWSVDFFVDCQAVVDNIGKLLVARAEGWPFPVVEHTDLWGMIWSHILRRPKECIRITKVKAHVSLESLDDSNLKWCAFMNNVVDDLAKKVVKDQKSVFAQFEKQSRIWKHQESMLHQYQEYWCCIQERCLATRIRIEPLHPQLGPPVCVGDPLRCDFPLGGEFPDNCPFGIEFAQSVRTYLRGLTWFPTGEPVSLLELYLDFSISQKMMTPVLLPTGIKNNKGRMIKRYELRHRNLLADHQPCDLASQSKVWHACISWFWDHCGHTPGHIVSKCSSLAKYGYSIPCKGLSCGVILYDAVSTQQALWKAFHTNRGTRRNLKGLWRSYPNSIVEA